MDTVYHNTLKLAIFLSINYDESVTVNVSVKTELTENFIKDIIDVTNNAVEIAETGEDFIAAKGA